MTKWREIFRIQNKPIRRSPDSRNDQNAKEDRLDVHDTLTTDSLIDDTKQVRRQ